MNTESCGWCAACKKCTRESVNINSTTELAKKEKISKKILTYPHEILRYENRIAFKSEEHEKKYLQMIEVNLSPECLFCDIRLAGYCHPAEAIVSEFCELIKGGLNDEILELVKTA